MKPGLDPGLEPGIRLITEAMRTFGWGCQVTFSEPCSLDVPEDSGGWTGYGLIEVAGRDHGACLVVVDDDEGLEAALEIDVVAGDGFGRRDAGGDL
jgi:hypothetical protein